MNSTLAYIRSRRAWLVEGLAVWGADSEAEFLMAVCDTVASTTRLGVWRVSLGGQQQDVAFSDLTDARGNALPVEIKKPAVIVIPRSSRMAFVKSVNGDTGISLARCDCTAAPAMVDLLIFETGG